ncbi:MAG: hypothetical protein ABSB15_26750 [Bryobacteraceae bacterium]|jgi:hypothetical protein
MRPIAAVVVCGWVCGSLAYAADLPSGDSLMDLAVTRGGAAAYARAKNVVMTGTVEMAGHAITGPISVYQQGDKSYSAIELPGMGKVEEGFDGETAWEMNALQGPRIKEGEEKAASVRASKLTSLGSWRDDYKAARTLGIEDLDGKPAWKVELTPREGKPEIFYFDQKSVLLVRVTQTLSTAMGDIPVDAGFADYRVVDGIETPFTMVQKAMGQTINMHFDKVIYNAEMAGDRFQLPAAVKALLVKRKP